MAYNSAGPGPESERFLERTFKLRPQKPPTAVQVTIGIVDVDAFQLLRFNFHQTFRIYSDYDNYLKFRFTESIRPQFELHGDMLRHQCTKNL